MENTDFFSAKNLIKRWYLHGLFKLSMIFQELGNVVFRAVFIIGFYFNFYASPNNKVYCGRDLVVCIFVLFNFLCKRIIKKNFVPITIITFILSSWHIFSHMRSKYFPFLSFSWVANSFASMSKSEVLQLFGSLIHCFLMLLLLLATAKPSTAIDKCVCPLFIVLNVILVHDPDVSGVGMISSLAKVLWLQLSKRAYVVTSFLLLAYLTLTGAMHILPISPLHDTRKLTLSN